MGDTLEVVIHRIHGPSLRGLIVTTNVFIFLAYAGEWWLEQNVIVGEKDRTRKLPHMGLLSASSVYRVRKKKRYAQTLWRDRRGPKQTFIPEIYVKSRSQWPRGLRYSSVAACLLRSWVRIPPRAWMPVCCECCVLSGRGLCDELITRPEESYRLCCVVVCDLETSRIGAPYIYDFSSIRVDDLTLILLMWRKWWTPNNASKWQMGFNSAFKGLNDK